MKMASSKDVNVRQHCQVSSGPRMSASFSSERTIVLPPAERPADSEGCKIPGRAAGAGRARSRSGLSSQGLALLWFKTI